jgi:hypothetical protein
VFIIGSCGHAGTGLPDDVLGLAASRLDHSVFVLQAIDRCPAVEPAIARYKLEYGLPGGPASQHRQDACDHRV